MAGMADDESDKTNDCNEVPPAGLPDGGRVTREVLEALRGGDPAAFDIVYLTYKSNTLDFVTKLIHSREVAEDIMQEIFIGIWEQRGHIDPAAGIKRNIFVRARSRAIDHLRRNRKFAALPDDYEESEGRFSAAPDQTFIEKEMLLLLEIALEAMPPQRREVYRLNAGGMNHEQIAKELGITNENARKHLSRAKKDLSVLRSLAMFFLVLP